MKQKEVFNKIGGIIKELNDQYNYLQAETENLNELELELFISNARFLTDHIEILCKLNLQNSYNQAAPPKRENKPEQNYFEPIVQQSGQDEPESVAQPEAGSSDKNNGDSETRAGIDLNEGVPIDTYSYTRQAPDVIRHELVLDESVNWEEDDEEPAEKNVPPQRLHEKTIPAAAAHSDEKPAEEIQAKIPPADKQPAQPFTKPEEKEVVTINEKISAQLEGKGTHAGPVTAAPLSDIKQAINLNDKLLFIKDLFNGYSLAYAEVIDILNRLNTFEEATNFLNKNYAVKNGWESKPETVEKFYAILRRRYGGSV